MASGFLSDLLRSFAFGIVGKTSTIKSADQVEVPTTYRGVPLLDPEKCILCGRCGKVCPAGAISLRTSPTEKSVRIFVGHCIFCSECARICPVSAITMSKIWDTAVTDRLSRDTMNTREVKRRKTRRKEKSSQTDTGEHTEAAMDAEQATSTPPLVEDKSADDQ
ncbi:MAG: 4Fe-4S dicluster domain-containing protein [Halobacteriota archaeon]